MLYWTMRQLFDADGKETAKIVLNNRELIDRYGNAGNTPEEAREAFLAAARRREARLVEDLTLVRAQIEATRAMEVPK